MPVDVPAASRDKALVAGYGCCRSRLGSATVGVCGDGRSARSRIIAVRPRAAPRSCMRGVLEPKRPSHGLMRTPGRGLAGTLRCEPVVGLRSRCRRTRSLQGMKTKPSPRRHRQTDLCAPDVVGRHRQDHVLADQAGAASEFQTVCLPCYRAEWNQRSITRWPG
jgi:hypothetical protein